MRWNDLREREPRFAEPAQGRLIAPGVLLVVTMRRDGTPRLSPVEPLIFKGDLWLSMMWQSPKASDLLRDVRAVGGLRMAGGSAERRGARPSSRSVRVRCSEERDGRRLR